MSVGFLRRRKQLNRIRRKQRCRPRLEQLEDRRLLAVISWDGEGGDDDWHNAANWFNETTRQNNVLPGAADDAQISSDFDRAVIQVGRDVEVNSLQSAAGLHIDGVEFKLNDTSQLDGSVLLEGELLGDGTVTVTGSMDWIAGKMGDGGTTVIDRGATLTIDAPDGVSIHNNVGGEQARVIENSGTIHWVRGRIDANDPLVLNNRPSGLLNIQADAHMGHGSDGRLLNNEGIVRKSAGTSRTNINMRLNNTGTVEVLTGTLAFTHAGMVSGDIFYGPDTTLELRGRVTGRFGSVQDPMIVTLDSTASLVGGHGDELTGTADGRLLIADRNVVIQDASATESGLLDVPLLEVSSGRRPDCLPGR